MTRTARISAVAAALVMVGAAATPIAARLQQRDSYDKSFWAGMRYRNIGPARGGRVRRSDRARGLQSVQSVCREEEPLQPVQSVRGQEESLQPVQSLLGQ